MRLDRKLWCCFSDLSGNSGNHTYGKEIWTGTGRTLFFDQFSSAYRFLRNVLEKGHYLLLQLLTHWLRSPRYLRLGSIENARTCNTNTTINFYSIGLKHQFVLHMHTHAHTHTHTHILVNRGHQKIGEGKWGHCTKMKIKSSILNSWLNFFSNLKGLLIWNINSL